MEILYAVAIFMRLALAEPAPPPEPSPLRAEALVAPLRVRRAPAQRTVNLIVRAADRARIPRSYALSVCFVESGLQLHNPRALLCGCALHTRAFWSSERQATCAAVSLRTQRNRCGTFPRALRAYQTGLCDREWFGYSRVVRRVVRRLRAVGIP